MRTENYVTDLENYSGPVDRISPYHFYQYNYWHLRGKWRRLLYDWTRRTPADASAVVSPNIVPAGVRETLTITVTVGDTPIPPGGRLAVYFPLDMGGACNRGALSCFQPPNGSRGYGSRIVAEAPRDDVEITTLVHSTGSVFTCVEAILETGPLNPGDTIDVIIGHPDTKAPIVSEKAKCYPFRVAIDYTGDDTFLPVRPDPTVRVVGNRARYLRCLAPATPEPGEPFAVRVIAADLQNHNPSYYHTGRLTFDDTAGIVQAPDTVDMPESAHGSMPVPNLILTDKTATRINVIDRANGLMGMTNPVCPEAAPAGLKLYYGEIHSHTDLSDGVGTAEDNYRWARDAEGLDFAALADHFEDGQSYNATLEDKWRVTREVTNAFNEPHRFVTLLGYEIGTVEKHRNVYFRDGKGRMIVGGPDDEAVTMENVFRKLDGTDYILIPHAPKFHGIDWYKPHVPDRQRLVEIFSYWGDSEQGGPLSVRHGLDLGYKLGFTGGTDSHTAEPGHPDIGGILGLYATELTRPAVFDALMARHTFATTGPRMILNVRLNGAFMGDEITLPADTPRTLDARILTGDPIDTIEIIRNGQVVHAMPGDDGIDKTIRWTDTDPLTDLTPERELTDERYAFYYVRVVTKNADIGYASPIFVHAEQ